MNLVNTVNILKDVIIRVFSMSNITVSIPDDIRKRMKKYPEIKWSEIVRRSILEYLDKLKGGETLDISYYTKIADRMGIDLEKISFEDAEKHYKKMRELNWKRSSTTQTSS